MDNPVTFHVQYCSLLKKKGSTLHTQIINSRKMKRELILLTLLSLLLFPGIHASGSKSSSPALEVNIDWAKFMSEQDMIWEVLPQAWYEAPFMGNGTLGLMVWYEPKLNAIRLETGNSLVHDHRPEKGLFGNPRLLTGHFLLQPQGKITGGTIRLDLWNAEMRAEIQTTEGSFQLEAMVNAADPVIQTRWKLQKEENISIKWIPASANSPRYQYGLTPAGSWMKMPESYTENPPAKVKLSPKGGISLQTLPAGGETAIYWQTDKSSEWHELWINVAHSYPERNACKVAEETVLRAQQQGWNSLRTTHQQWWHNFYPASFFSVDDGIKESFYWIQLYKLASATRADGALIDNTGPWLTVTPWPNAWWNLNVQLTYWPLNTSNHLDLARSLENAIYGNIENLRTNIPGPYRYNSLGIGRTSDLECASETVGIPGKDPTAEIGLLTWTCHNLWLIYRHKMDDQLLKEHLFPVLKGSVNYYLHFLYKGKDGRLHLPVTYSPEYGSAEDCNFDLALLKWGCQTLTEICKRLGIKDCQEKEWRDVLKNLTSFPCNQDGLMIGRNVPYSSSHRHFSHLMSAYPLHLLNPENPEERALIERSLTHWLSKPEGLRGYSFTAASSLYSTLGQGDKALEHLTDLFDKLLGVNTLYQEAGPVIETPLSGAQSVHDMLLQSWGNKIRVFPAVPSLWNNLNFHNWRTEGAFLISARRTNGKTEFIRILSEAGEPCTIVTDIQKPIFEGKRNFQTQQTAPNTYVIDLKKGEEVFIRNSDTPTTFTISPQTGDSHLSRVYNPFGKKALH